MKGFDVEKSVLKANNFSAFNEIQKKAVKKKLYEKNLVVSAPTASGKTLIAELAILYSVFVERKKAVFTCPLRALASEHFSEIKKKYSFLGLKCALSIGDFDSSSNYLFRYDVIFCTNEKLDSLLRHNAIWLKSVGLLVIDEIHELDSLRGPTLEMAVAKMRSINSSIKLLALSATIPNAEAIALWLKAQLIESNYRPVKLREGVAFSGKISFNDKTEINYVEKNFVEQSLAFDSLKLGKQALFFINNRKHTESLAVKLAGISKKFLSGKDKKILSSNTKRVLSVLESPTAQCKKLAFLLERGIAFHHAGLLQKQRELVEELFRTGRIKILTATTTLAAGLNLPSFRVILPSVYRFSGTGMQPIPVREYKQMVGRAGRPKYDSEGQGVLLAKNEEDAVFLFENYVLGQPEEVFSQLGFEPVLRMHVLALFAGNLVFSLEGLQNFFKKTFFSTQFPLNSLYEKLQKTVFMLEEMGFLEVKNNCLQATVLGKRVSELYLDPLTASLFLDCLEKKLSDFGLLFMLCSATEFYPLLSVSRSLESEVWRELLARKNLLPVDIEKAQFEDFRLIEKFYSTLMLEEWLSESREQELLETFNIQPGFLFSKLQVLDWLAYAVIELARISNKKDLIPKIMKLKKRLKYGVKQELLELIEFKGVGRIRARKLFNAGIKTVLDVKKADVKDLEKIVGRKTAETLKHQTEMFLLRKKKFK